MPASLVQEFVSSLLRKPESVKFKSQSDFEILSSVYTPYSKAIKIIQERWTNNELSQRLDKQGKLPQIVKDFSKPHAVLCRPIIVPNQEVSYFLDLAEHSGLPHVFLEYQDKFVARNIDKRALGKIICTQGTDRHGRRIYKKTSVINFNSEEGKMLGDIKTQWGEPLIDFKRKLLEFVYPDESSKIYNLTDWFNKRRYATKYYYLDFLSIFLRHGILFENFLLGDRDERTFFFEKVLPSFKRLESQYGFKPLIVPLLPLELEKNEHWLAYPERLGPEIQKHAILKA